jgi:predicted nucleic acid-binding protein
MILVDSSAFIEYYRPGGDPGASDLVARAIHEDLVCINGIVQVEVVSFASSPAAFEALREDFKGFVWLDLPASRFDEATRLGHDLRRIGVTAPPTDLVIASSAMAAGATLYHLDDHFDLIAEHTALASRHIGTRR